MRRGGAPSLQDPLKLNMLPKSYYFPQEAKATPLSPRSVGPRVGTPLFLLVPGYFTMPRGSPIPDLFKYSPR